MPNTDIELQNDRIEELRAWMGINEEIRHCHGCNYHYHEDNWVEAKHNFDYVCKECGSNYKNSELILTLISKTEAK